MVYRMAYGMVWYGMVRDDTVLLLVRYMVCYGIWYGMWSGIWYTVYGIRYIV